MPNADKPRKHQPPPSLSEQGGEQAAFIERVVPGKTPVFIIWAHAARYRFARDMAKGRRVLDAGCGEGYGTYYLSHHAASTVGIDISVDTLQAARKRYERRHLAFAAMDCRDIAFADSMFDMVCSFEVIEHMHSAEKFVAEVRRMLSPGGVLVVSTPNRRHTSGRNPYHVEEFDLKGFTELLGRYFTSVETYGQFCRRPVRQAVFILSCVLWICFKPYRRLLTRFARYYFTGDRSEAASTKPDWVERMGPESFDFRPGKAQRAPYFVAVCRA